MYFYFFYFTGFSFECFALKAFFHHCLYWLYNRHLHNTTTQCRNFHSSFLHNLSLYAETGGRKYYSSDQLTDSIYWNLGYIMIIDNSVLCFINNFKEKNWSTAYLLLYIFFLSLHHIDLLCFVNLGYSFHILIYWVSAALSWWNKVIWGIHSFLLW